MEIYNDKKKKLKTIILCLFQLCILSHSSLALGAWIQLSPSDTTSETGIQTLVWSSQLFEVETSIIDGKTVGTVKIDGQFSLPDSDLLPSVGEVIYKKDGKVKKPLTRDFSLVLPLPNEGSDEEIDFQFNIRAIASSGDIQEEVFHIVSVMGPPRNFWENRIHISWLPYGIYSFSNVFGGTTQTRYYSNIFELGHELRFFRARSPDLRSLELNAAASLSYIPATGGLTFPPFWNAGLQMGVRNLLGKDGKGWSITPHATLQVETFSSTSPVVSSVNTFEVGTLTSLWVGMGCKLRWKGSTRWFEFVPQIYRTIMGTSTVPSLPGTSTFTAWKYDLQATVPIVHRVFSGLRLTALQGSGDIQLQMFMSSLLFGYQF